MVIDVARRARAGGVAAAAVVALVLLAALGGPVGAASEATFTGLVPGAVAQVVGSTGGPNRTYTAGLMALTIDGTPGAAGYCIDIHTDIADGTSGLQEVDWATSGVANLDAVERILRSYHPNGVGPDGYRISGTTAQMAAATQAAIWHYTDGFELAGQGNDPVVVANYEAILAAVAAGVLPTFGEPGVSLDIEAPGTTEATAGEPIGPYVVRTTAGEVTLTASPGAEIVDEHGEPLPGPVTDGTSFWLVSQEPGSATVTATAEATVLAGRAFAKPGVQRMILATTTTTTVDAEASGSWTTPPTTEPPTTEPPTTEPPTTEPPTTEPPTSEPPTTEPPTTVPVEPRVSTPPEPPRRAEPVEPQPAAPAPAPAEERSGDDLPRTGGDVWPLVAVGAVLVGAGGVLGVVARRRTR